MPGQGGLLEGFCAEPGQEERIAVNVSGRLLFLRVADVTWMVAGSDSVALRVGGETHVVPGTLAAMMAKLPAGRFWRISRSMLLNRAQVLEVQRTCRGGWRVLLRDGTRLILIGRSLATPRQAAPSLPARLIRPAWHRGGTRRL